MNPFCLLRRHGLYIAWVISMCALLGSLYYSEIKNLEPCHLCWYQRISVYPLALILGIAAYRQDKSIVTYAIPLASIGAFFSFYQILIQSFPGFAPLDLCGRGPSCDEVQVIYFDFLTMAMLSFLAFIAIIISLLFARSRASFDKLSFD